VNFARSCNGRCRYILWTFGLICGHLKYFYGHVVYLVIIWYIFPRFGMLYQEKSGNPDTLAVFISARTGITDGNSN
jgi:hypothetical protein